MSAKLQREAYQKLIDETFKKQIKFITNEIDEENKDQAMLNEDYSSGDEKKSFPVNRYYSEEANNLEEKRLLGGPSTRKKKKKVLGESKKGEDKIIKVYKKSQGNNNNNINS